MSDFYNNAVFWIEVDRIKPNPYQPRREFNEDALNSLADSIRQYGVLQPLVVTRYEVEKDEGGLATEYELIAGERRLRASKIAGLSQVPALIRDPEQSEKVKLELAIIENLQREDLSPIERAEAFYKLVEDFGFKHVEVAKKVGKSREYVSNSLRLLALPDHIKSAIEAGEITEGHARPLLMLSDRPDEQEVLFKEVTLKKLTVRDTEDIARRIATDKVRKKVHEDPRMGSLEKELAEALGTRVRIQRKGEGGKITIDFFSDEDLGAIIGVLDNRSLSEIHGQDDDLEDNLASHNKFSSESTNENDTDTKNDEEEGSPELGDELQEMDASNIYDDEEEAREGSEVIKQGGLDEDDIGETKFSDAKEDAENLKEEAEDIEDDDLYNLKDFSV